MPWYNYTCWDGTTNTGTLQSRNGTKIGTVHGLACTIPPCCRLVVHDRVVHGKCLHILVYWGCSWRSSVRAQYILKPYLWQNVRMYTTHVQAVFVAKVRMYPPDPLPVNVSLRTRQCQFSMHVSAEMSGLLCLFIRQETRHLLQLDSEGRSQREGSALPSLIMYYRVAF